MNVSKGKLNERIKIVTIYRDMQDSRTGGMRCEGLTRGAFQLGPAARERCPLTCTRFWKFVIKEYYL